MSASLARSMNFSMTTRLFVQLVALSSFFGGTASASDQTLHIVQMDRSESVHSANDGGGSFFFIQQGDALQTIAFASNDPLTPFREVTRSFIEFTVPAFAGSITATLVIQKYYDVGNDLPNVPFELSVYNPQSEISETTFNIPTTPVITFTTDYTKQLEVVTIDISDIISQYRGKQVGFRLKVTDEGTLGEQFTRGAGFDDGIVTGIAPRIEVFEHAQAITELQYEVINLLGDTPLASSIATSLNAAFAAASNDDPQDDTAAANMLTAFINKVDAQRDKKIPSSTADALITAAELVRLLIE